MNRTTSGTLGLALPAILTLTLGACEAPAGFPDYQQMCSARSFEGAVLQEMAGEYVDDGAFQNLRFNLDTGAFTAELEIWNLGPSAQPESHPGEGCSYRGRVAGHLSGARLGGMEWEGQGRIEATLDAPGCPAGAQPIFVSLVLSDACDGVIGYWIHNGAEVGGSGKLMGTGFYEDPITEPGPGPEPISTPRPEETPTAETPPEPTPESSPTATPVATLPDVTPDAIDGPEPTPEPTPGPTP